MKDGKYIATDKMPEIGRCIITLLETKKIVTPKREKVWLFIKNNILDENGEEFTPNNVRQCKKRDKDGKLYKNKL